MKIIIAGGRDFHDYLQLKNYLDHVLVNLTEVEIVSGGCEGANKLGERYAKEKGHKLTIFPAFWKKYRGGAGPIRNQEMANYADALIAFHNGDSKGTADMIKKAKARNLEVRVRNY